MAPLACRGYVPANLPRTSLVVSERNDDYAHSRKFWNFEAFSCRRGGRRHARCLLDLEETAGSECRSQRRRCSTFSTADCATGRGQTAATPFVQPPEVSSKKTNAAILERIHLANLKEIEAAKIAEAKASSTEVRAYADQLIKDHTSADQMVTATAQKMGARLRDTATNRGKSTNGKQAEQKMSTANGAQFDRLFLEQTSADHKKLMTELKQERDDASDDDIEALIDKIMPDPAAASGPRTNPHEEGAGLTGRFRNHGRTITLLQLLTRAHPPTAFRGAADSPLGSPTESSAPS